MEKEKTEENEHTQPGIDCVSISDCIREAKKVDFLNKEELFRYAQALYDAKLWGLTVK